MADPTGRFVKHLPDWELEAVLPADIAHDRQTGSIRRPICRLNVLEDFLVRTPPGHPEACERSRPRKRDRGTPPERDCHLSGRRDREQLRFRKAEGARLRCVEAAHENLDGTSFPPRRVENRLAVGREPGRRDRAAAECELTEGGRRTVASPAKSDPGCQTANEGGRQNRADQ